PDTSRTVISPLSLHDALPICLDTQNIVRLFHYAQQFLVARRIAAEQTEVAFADVVTDRAKTELIFDVENGLRKTLGVVAAGAHQDRKSTRLNSSHVAISYAVF